MKADMQNMNVAIQGPGQRVTKIESKVTKVENDVAKVENKVTKIDLTIENELRKFLLWYTASNGCPANPRDSRI